MVFDHLNNAAAYVNLHPAFAEAFAFLRDGGVDSLDAGRHELAGDRLYANVEDVEGRGRSKARLEVHRQYIDVQYAVNGQDLIGWRPLDQCTALDTPYNQDKDYALYQDESLTWHVLPAGTFMIFWPHDAHAPLCGEGAMRKVVVKVPV